MVLELNVATKQQASDIKGDTENILNHFPIVAGGGIKSVQRGYLSESLRSENNKLITISAVNMDKTFVNIPFASGGADRRFILNFLLVSPTEIEVYNAGDQALAVNSNIVWEVIEFE